MAAATSSEQGPRRLSWVHPNVGWGLDFGGGKNSTHASFSMSKKTALDDLWEFVSTLITAQSVKEDVLLKLRVRFQAQVV